MLEFNPLEVLIYYVPTNPHGDFWKEVIHPWMIFTLLKKEKFPLRLLHFEYASYTVTFLRLRKIIVVKRIQNIGVVVNHWIKTKV